MDISNEYLAEFTDRLNKHGVKDIVTFIQADAANLKEVIRNGVADMVVSYRFLEELKQPKTMVRIVKEMVRIAKTGGKVSIVELCTKSKSEAEGTYIGLHRESGDSLFKPFEIVNAMKEAKLADVRVEEVGTDIWISPELARQDLNHAQVWYDAKVEKSLGKSIDKYGMKYPTLLIFSGLKK